jgi:hypothetical protein
MFALCASDNRWNRRMEQIECKQMLGEIGQAFLNSRHVVAVQYKMSAGREQCNLSKKMPSNVDRCGHLCVQEA